MPITCNYIWLLDDSSCGNAGTGLASHSSNSIRLIIKLMLIDCSLYASLFLSFFLSLCVPVVSAFWRVNSKPIGCGGPPTEGATGGNQ